VFKMLFQTLLLGAVAASAFIPAASGQVSQGRLTPSHLPPLKLDRPNWLPMTGPQIVEAFAGRMIGVDRRYEPYPGVRVNVVFIGGCPPGESFDRNGGWSKSVCFRALRTYKGKWWTEKFRGGERLCVEASDFPKLCRFVWYVSSERVIMAADSLNHDEPQDDPITFSPYRWISHGR